MIGTRLAHYEIVTHIGSGGMGDVYQATDTKLGRSVAIKFLPDAFNHDTERVARFQREARVLASLNHPNIAAIHGVEEIDSRHFLVMEFVAGRDLATIVQQNGKMSLAHAVDATLQAARGLGYAHSKNVVHRDIQPANVLLTEHGLAKLAHELFDRGRLE